jgi:Flp pilus assembly protein TadD
MQPERVGPYRLERKLGTGGMGVVYAAWDERLDRRVALKQIRPEIAGDLPRERFRREARAMARLDHPSIVRIHDLLETPDAAWLVLQYVEGPTLAQRLREGPLPPQRVVAVARDVLGALEAAHSQGLLHRDLKAENVVLSPSGRAMVLDFGLAKLYETGFPASRTAAASTVGVVGTYRAMSPEQANGLPLDPRSDLFSLGVMLYEAATGSSPFLGKTPIETLTRVCTHLQSPVHELVPAIPGPLSAWIDALLEKDPDRRPQSTRDALARLEGGAEPPLPPEAGETVAATPHLAASAAEPPPASVAPYRGLRVRRLPLVASTALLVVAVGLLLAWRLRAPRPPQPPLYVAVARPEVGLGAGREDVALAAAGLQAASLRALSALERVAALPHGAADHGEPAPTVQQLSRLLAADEVLTATLDCQARQCHAVLRRQRGSDGKILESTAPFEVPLDDFHLLDTAISTYLKPLYPDFSTRRGASELQVRAEDYQRYLRVQRTWEEKRPADLQPLLAELDQIRAGSPLFLDAYQLAGSLEGYRFFQTRNAKDLALALSTLGQARRLAPGEPMPLFNLFGVDLPAGRLKEAEEVLHELEQRLPGDARTLERRALLSERQGDKRQALELLRTAVERHPSAAFLMDLANLQMRLGEIPAARSTLEGLLQRLPGHPGGENLLAQLELETRPDRAAELYTDLARRHPSFAVFNNLAISQLLLGRYGDAATSLAHGYSLAPQSYAAALNLGDVDMLLGRRSEGEALYRRTLELLSRDPAADDWQVLAAKAQAQAHLGRRMEAAATIQRAVVAAPNNPEVAYDAALVYAVIGDNASAVASADRALASGYDRRWFSLPSFDPLRQDPAFRKLFERPYTNHRATSLDSNSAASAAR